jgi:S1-C subfamily serine protease
MSLFKKLLNMKRQLPVIVVITLLIVSVLLAGCAATATASPVAKPVQSAPPSSTTVAVPSAPLFDEATTVSMYEQSIPAVVQIESVVEATTKLPSPFNLGTPKQQGLGSGFMIDGQGHILTNNHVVDKASTVKVVLNDGTRLDAKVVGTDKYNDLALLQVDTSGIRSIKYLTLGDSSSVKPGQMSIALGSPFGLQGSITVGVVSGIGRSIPGSTDRTMTNIIQTDAAINPGNSGGPLLNSKGEVIGINTAIESEANGVGFAVGINTAKTLLPELLKGGAVKTAWLGIEGTPVTKDLADKLKLKADKGVYVVGVLSGSPAEKAGLVKSGRDNANDPAAGGDIITALDNNPVTKVQDMLTFFNSKRPGDKVNLSVQRGDQQITVPVELGEWPDNLNTRVTVTPDQNPGQGQNQDGGNGFDFGPFHFRIK